MKNSEDKFILWGTILIAAASLILGFAIGNNI